VKYAAVVPLFVGALAFAGAARAETGYTLGPGIGIAKRSGDGSAPVLGLDASIVSVKTGASGGQAFGPAWISAAWLSGGVNWIGADPGSVRIYAEGGTWLLAAVGAGCSANARGDATGRFDVHLFFGVPIPFSLLAAGPMPYVHPYYRPHWAVSGERAGFDFHEVGLMIKVALGER
jgi:hypothetical protein